MCCQKTSSPDPKSGVLVIKSSPPPPTHLLLLTHLTHPKHNPITHSPITHSPITDDQICSVDLVISWADQLMKKWMAPKTTMQQGHVFLVPDAVGPCIFAWWNQAGAQVEPRWVPMRQGHAFLRGGTYAGPKRKQDGSRCNNAMHFCVVKPRLGPGGTKLVPDAAGPWIFVWWNQSWIQAELR
jgi:hypothetical protein